MTQPERLVQLPANSVIDAACQIGRRRVLPATDQDGRGVRQGDMVEAHDAGQRTNDLNEKEPSSTSPSPLTVIVTFWCFRVNSGEPSTSTFNPCHSMNFDNSATDTSDAPGDALQASTTASLSSPVGTGKWSSGLATVDVESRERERVSQSPSSSANSHRPSRRQRGLVRPTAYNTSNVLLPSSK